MSRAQLQLHNNLSYKASPAYCLQQTAGSTWEKGLTLPHNYAQRQTAEKETYLRASEPGIFSIKQRRLTSTAAA